MGTTREIGGQLDQLFGAWVIEPERFQSLIEQVRTADLNALRAQFGEPSEPDYAISGGIATVELTGPMMKRSSFLLRFFGGSSTQQVQANLEAAVRDPQVRAILLHVDSPGGQVAGTQELADAVRAADEQKPVFSYMEDLGASGAYWVGSQARRIFTNKAGAVGGIGTFSVVVDTSGNLEQAGIRIHVVKSGRVKGLGVPGAPVTEEHLAERQRMVDSYADLFIRTVARVGRITVAQARALADGRLHFGDQARQVGLVDAVGTLEEARRLLARQTMSKSKTFSMDDLPEAAQARIRELEEAERDVKAKVAAFEQPREDPLASLTPEARALVEKAQSDALEASTRVRELEASARADRFKVKAKALGQAAEFGAVLAAASEAMSAERFAALERVLQAQHEQIREGKLFSEAGTGETPDQGSATQRARARAAQFVAEGKAENETAALSEVFRQDPRLHREYTRESEIRV